MYSPQVWPEGGLKMFVSRSVHSICRPYNIAFAMPPTQ